ncbi:hypothetical protein HO910_10615, partial [Streptococcus suis]|nr:hypothetical protein [Streptococcus suis]
VNGADRADLATREESFTYHITSAVPTDATAFEISDTLVSLTIGGFSGLGGVTGTSFDFFFVSGLLLITYSAV